MKYMETQLHLSDSEDYPIIQKFSEECHFILTTFFTVLLTCTLLVENYKLGTEYICLSDNKEVKRDHPFYYL